MPLNYLEKYSFYYYLLHGLISCNINNVIDNINYVNNFLPKDLLIFNLENCQKYNEYIFNTSKTKDDSFLINIHHRYDYIMNLLNKYILRWRHVIKYCKIFDDIKKKKSHNLSVYYKYILLEESINIEEHIIELRNYNKYKIGIY